MARDNSKFKKYNNEYEPSIIEHMRKRDQEKDKTTDEWLMRNDKSNKSAAVKSIKKNKRENFKTKKS